MTLYQSAVWTPGEEGVRWGRGTLADANLLLSQNHYLGPSRRQGVRFVFVGWLAGQPVAAQVWRTPTSRKLPSDWLELSRWCLTPEAGSNAGSRMMGWVVRWLKANTSATTLISYSDPSVGHTGTLYRACGWRWVPTWLRLRPPPGGAGSWDGVLRQEPKDRWALALSQDDRREELLSVKDAAAVRHWESMKADDLCAEAWHDGFREGYVEGLTEHAASASSDAPGNQPGEGGSQPTTPLHDHEWYFYDLDHQPFPGICMLCGALRYEVPA